jgi:NTP pyrophosphatase (non-canonical NTP hydrolase)
MQPERLALLNELIHELGDEMHYDSERWFGVENATNMTIYTLGLGGEAGEVLDIVKKVARGSLDFEDIQLVAQPCDNAIGAEPADNSLPVELIDVFHYWTMLIGMNRVDVAKVYTFKRAYNEMRFGDGSSSEAGDAFAGI